jgi:alpha-1,2-mannosyltransferase
VGAATAVKLSPGGVVLTYVAARRWRPVALASATLAACWLVSSLLLPGDTTDWLAVVLDADRVGPVDAAVNTSWHGLVLRLLGSGTAAQAVWVALAIATLAVGAVRSARALAHDDALRAATVMGLAIVLAAPISWSHHIVWVVPLVGLLVGSGRSWRGWLLATGVTLVFSEPGMRWTDYALGTPQLSGVLDWFWVNGCILVMAAAVLLLPVGGQEGRPS